MNRKRYPGVLSVLLAWALFSVSVPLAAPGDEKKTEEKPAASEKTNVKGDKSKEAATQKPDAKGSETAPSEASPAGAQPTSIFARAVRKKDPDVKVFTNEDLGQMAPQPPQASDGGTPPSTNERRTSSPTEDPLTWMKQQEERAAERREMVQTEEAALAAARKKLEELQKQLLATVNPFAARPQLSDDEKEIRATTKESAEERYERTKALVEEAQKEVAAAEQRLARVKAQQ